MRDSVSCAGRDTCQHMQYGLPEVEAQTTVNTLCDMDGKASVNTLADRVEEVNTDKVGKTLTDVIGALLVC